MKLVIFSICHNEAATVGELLDRIPKKIDGISVIQKLVIDDGSSDGTAKVAEAHGAKVFNDGAQKRLAFRFREALDIALAAHADIMVNIDGDLQFQPEDIPRLVKPIVDGRADFVAADRFSDPESGKFRRPANMALGKYLGNRLGARVVSGLSRHEFHDVTCGFRAYNHKALISLNTDGTHTYTQESFQVLAMKRLRIASMPVQVRYYPERKSRVVKSIGHYVAVSSVNILRSYRDFAPLRFFGWLGFVPALIGVLFLIFFIGHWIFTGQFSPYKFTGFAGVYFLTMGIIFWALGLVADMLSRMLNNQEKILERLKRLEHDK
ncbi:MAG TPA: glycosyltransferase family 2 protein [Candidatus Saccharimonadales bacterium]|nr:glycosyltransferase family 2 protein [Candidatus Saccharimonadales bacterium]